MDPGVDHAFFHPLLLHYGISSSLIISLHSLFAPPTSKSSSIWEEMRQGIDSFEVGGECDCKMAYICG